jgi:sugar phosphate isomerase/epimerase
MSRLVSLAHLTVLSLPPPDMIEVAARTGYDAVGLRLIAVTDTTPGYPLMHDGGMLRATKAALKSTGIAVHDIEFVKITPDLDVRALEPVVATGAELGARCLVTAPYDPDLDRLAEKLAALADLAKPYRVVPVLEFFPWTVVPDLAAAARVVAATRAGNCGILLDALHFSRSGGTAEGLARIPAHMISFLHLCDAPAEHPATTEAMLHTARSERLPPGTGGLDLGVVLDGLAGDVPVGIEVPMDALTRELGPEAVARRCREATRRVLDATAQGSAGA